MVNKHAIGNYVLAEIRRKHKNKWQRKYREENHNVHTRLYEKTKSGFLMRVYRNIKSRVLGVQPLKAHLYSHIKDIPTKEAFYIWANKNKTFHTLFKVWEENGYQRKLTPSVDRINSTKGYEFNNIEWVTHSENSSRGARSKHEKNISNS